MRETTRGRPWLLASICFGFWLATTGHLAQASELRRSAIVKAVEQARPSIVNIQGEKTVAAEEGAASAEGYRRVNGMGTGILIDERGYIITNHHVVDGVRKITVTTSDGTAYTAKRISHDLATDLAIIKIDSPEKFPVITLGASNDLMTGESVIAVGNAFGYQNTVTRGIISALHRTVQVSDAQSYEDLIQTDASINPGNSGGPLLNIDGEMIGVNVAVRAGAQGIGFAIPVDKVMEITADLLSTRRISKTWHGVVAVQEQGPRGTRVVVREVSPGSPAETLGLKAGDVLRTADDQALARPVDLERALLDKAAGDGVRLAVDRESESLELQLTLAAAPSSSLKEANPVWEVLGLELRPIPSRQFASYRSNYRGGLSIVSVRADSPAAQQGLQTGDVLVGMHVWSTVSLENVNYILDRPDFEKLAPLKFYILRGNETLHGQLQVTHRR